MNQEHLRQVVYIDESYIHKIYQRHDDSLFGTDDEQYLEDITMHIGRLHYSIAAINDEDKPFVDDADYERPRISKARSLHETHSVSKGANQQTID